MNANNPCQHYIRNKTVDSIGTLDYNVSHLRAIRSPGPGERRSGRPARTPRPVEAPTGDETAQGGDELATSSSARQMSARKRAKACQHVHSRHDSRYPTQVYGAHTAES